MKNLCPRGKGGGVQIHPSHSQQDDAAVLAALALLPPAVIALASELGTEDREVLAYLVTMSMKEKEEERRCSGSRAHKPAFDCGCFDCYTSFWLRWDSSPDREAIHRAIEAFEEHLDSADRKNGDAGKRRGGGKKGKGKNKAGGRGVTEEARRATSSAADGRVEEGGGRDAGGGEGQVGGGGGGERRKGWTDVLGLLRSWSPWTPAA